MKPQFETFSVKTRVTYYAIKTRTSEVRPVHWPHPNAITISLRWIAGQPPTAECNATLSAFWLIDSTRHKHNWDADNHSIQIFPAVYVTRSSLLCSQQIPVLSQINSVHTLTFHFLKTDFNIILPSYLTISLPFKFQCFSSLCSFRSEHFSLR
jgi:hypothetical protein